MSIAKWIPDRKVLGGGIVGIASFFISTGLGLDTETASQISAAVWLVANYFIPASVKDVVNKMDGTLKKMGVSDSETVGEMKKKVGA